MSTVKPLNLAIVRQRYTSFGGAERFVERALAALSADGLHVTVITRKWGGAGEKAAERDVHICNPFYIGRWWRDAGFSAAVRRLLKRCEFDLVQSHERIPGCDIFRAGDGVHATWLELRGRQQNRLQRFLTRWHPWHRYTCAAERRMFADSGLRAVICNSHMVRADIERRFGVSAEKLHVIHNGVDLEYFNPGLKAQYRVDMRNRLGIETDTPVVLYVGSGFARKGVPQLLQAMTELRHNTAVAVIVGKDKHIRRMQSLTDSLGLAERVHFVGPQQDVRPWYGMADVLALPTLYDPFPSVVLEALACGLPVMTSPSCGAAEILTGLPCGRVCDALAPTKQAAALDALLDVPAEEHAACARASVGSFGREDMGRRLQALYKDLLSVPVRPEATGHRV